jgi:hypothetical protein
MARTPRTEETVLAIVMRDFWTSDDDESRQRAGKMIEVTKDDLIAGMEAGTLARAK